MRKEIAHTITLICCLICCLSLSACGTYAKWTYPVRAAGLTRVYSIPKHPYKVAVLPFKENRGYKNSFSTLFLYLIPLVPYGWVHYERPEAARTFNTISEYDLTLDEDFAKAVVTSLKESNIFKDVYFTFGGEKENADFIFLGEVHSTIYEGKTFSYGLSVFGPLLWFFVLPAGTSHNDLVIHMVLKDRVTDKTIWEYTIDKKLSLIQGLYYNYGYDVKGYSILMQEGMNEAIRSLDRAIAQLPFGINP